MYESTDNEQKNEEHADSDGNDEYEQRICPEEKHSVARLTDDSMTWAVENSMSERSEALLSRGMLWLVAPCVLFARQVTSVCSRRPTSRVPVVMEPRTCSSVLGTTLSASMNWTVLGGLESTMHSHFMVVIATSKRQEELAWTSGASGKAKVEKMRKVWFIFDIVFYEASAFRWTYTTHSEGQDLICCVLLCYWQYSTVHSGVWRHSAAQILVLCAVGLHCHRTTRSCSPQGERHRSRSSAQIHLPSPSAGTRPPRSPEHLHPARKCTSIYFPFLKAQRLVNPFHYFYLNIHDLNYRFHSSWNISCKAQILDLYFHCCSSQAMHMVTQ